MKFQAYNLFAYAAFILLIPSFLLFGQSYEIHCFKEAVITPYPLLFWVFSILFVFLWALYKGTHMYLYSALLKRVHIVITLVVVLLIVTVNWWGNLIYTPRRYFDYTHPAYSLNNQVVLDTITNLILLLLISTQLVYVVNITLGFIKTKTIN